MDAPPFQADPSASSGPGCFLLIDANGVPYTYTALVDDEAPRAAPERGPDCPECGRVFESALRLQSHRISHSQLKPFICGACGKAFKRSSHLSRHRAMHQPGGSRCHACPLCPRRFNDAGELAQHVRGH